jgi:hypothetical protein
MDEKLLKQGALVTSFFVYLAIIGACFDSEVQAKFTQAFGEYVLGIPILAFHVLIMTLIFIPFPFVSLSFLRIVLTMAAEDRGMGGMSIIINIFTIAKRHPHLKKSSMVCICGLLFYVLIVIAWIWYAETKGILPASK